jgi:hypothetical protein
MQPVNNCMNQSQVKEIVKQYMEVTMPKTTLILIGVSLAFTFFLFFQVNKLFRNMNKNGIINTKLGMAQFMMLVSMKPKLKDLKGNEELANFMFYFGLLIGFFVLISVQVALLILNFRNLYGG